MKIKIDKKKDVFCLLNPKGDLEDTENNIKPILIDNKIQFLTNLPTPFPNVELQEKIKKTKMYLFCGHGDSVKYLGRKFIESNDINFMTFLFGCSSSNTKILVEKDIHPYGLPQILMKNNCPFLFGYLWPIFSVDVDKFTVAFFKELFTETTEVSQSTDIKTKSLLEQILKYKRKIKKRYINASASVIYANNDICVEIN